MGQVASIYSKPGASRTRALRGMSERKGQDLALALSFLGADSFLVYFLEEDSEEELFSELPESEELESDDPESPELSLLSPPLLFL